MKARICVVSFASLALMTACQGMGGAAAPGATKPTRDRGASSTRTPPSPAAARDPRLDQRLARTELRLLEKEAQVEELQARLDDARREVVRSMAKLQSLATRAEAASGMAEAEIALQSVRATPGAPRAAEAGQLMQLSSAEFDRQNYAGALYLASQSKAAALAARGELSNAGRGALRSGEVPFALPLKLQATARVNVREGPGSSFAIVMTLQQGAPLTGHSYAEEWVRISDDTGRGGWVYQGLISRRR